MEFFRGKGQNQRNSSEQNPYFSQNSLGANRDCTEFLRGYHIISKILEG